MMSRYPEGAARSVAAVVGLLSEGEHETVAEYTEDLNYTAAELDEVLGQPGWRPLYPAAKQHFEEHATVSRTGQDTFDVVLMLPTVASDRPELALELRLAKDHEYDIWFVQVVSITKPRS